MLGVVLDVLVLCVYSCGWCVVPSAAERGMPGTWVQTSCQVLPLLLLIWPLRGGCAVLALCVVPARQATNARLPQNSKEEVESEFQHRASRMRPAGLWCTRR